MPGAGALTKERYFAWAKKPKSLSCHGIGFFFPGLPAVPVETKSREVLGVDDGRTTWRHFFLYNGPGKVRQAAEAPHLPITHFFLFFPTCLPKTSGLFITKFPHFTSFFGVQAGRKLSNKIVPERKRKKTNFIACSFRRRRRCLPAGLPICLIGFLVFFIFPPSDSWAI